MTQVQAWHECKVLISYVYAYEAAAPSMAQGYPNTASRDQTLISSVINRWKLTVFYFTVVTWPTSTSKAGGDLALIQTPLLFSLKYQLVSMIITWFTQQKQWSWSNQGHLQPLNRQLLNCLFISYYSLVKQKISALINQCTEVTKLSEPDFMCLVTNLIQRDDSHLITIAGNWPIWSGDLGMTLYTVTVKSSRSTKIICYGIQV